MDRERNGDAGTALLGAGTERRTGADRRSGLDRRRLSPRTLIRSGITPRRRGGRRHGEAHGVIDWHEPHLLFLTIMILLLSVADAFMTLTLLTRPGIEEANPVLAWVLNHRPSMFAVVKMTLTGAGVVVLVALARARLFSLIKVSAILHSCLAMYVALIGYEWWLFRQAF